MTNITMPILTAAKPVFIGSSLVIDAAAKAANPTGGVVPKEALDKLVAGLERFPKVVQGAADAYEPSQISRYLLDLAEEFNSFYSGGNKIVSTT